MDGTRAITTPEVKPTGRIKAALARFIPARLRALRRKYWKTDRPSVLSVSKFNGFEVAFRKGTADEQVIDHGFEHDIYFSGVPEYRPTDTDVIIDVGAHIGTFALLASSKVGRGKVYAIEASEDSFNLLRVNVALNHAANISCHHLAITDKRGTCTLHHYSGNWGHSVVKQHSTRGETVTCTTLADFFEENGIQNCHFLKLNCEGAEFPLLLSAPKSVLQMCQVILVLYHCDMWRNNTQDDLISHLEASGFETTIRNRSEKRGWVIATNSRRAA